MATGLGVKGKETPVSGSLWWPMARASCRRQSRAWRLGRGSLSGQARPALCQAAVLQHVAEGEHLQAPGHHGLEAGRLHPHPAVHQAVWEQLAEPIGHEETAERAEHGRCWWQQAGAAQGHGQRLLLWPGLPLLHLAPARSQEGDGQNGWGHQKLHEHLHPVQEAYCRSHEWPSHWARSIHPASLWCGLGQWKGVVPDAL